MGVKGELPSLTVKYWKEKYKDKLVGKTSVPIWEKPLGPVFHKVPQHVMTSLQRLKAIRFLEKKLLKTLVSWFGEFAVSPFTSSPSFNVFPIYFSKV